MSFDPQDALDLERIRLEEAFGTKDIKSQLKFLRRGWKMDRGEMKRQHKYKDADLGDDMAARGLGFSGIKQGALSRSLEDLTFQKQRAALDVRSQQDALRRALQRLRAESALARSSVAASALGD